MIKLSLNEAAEYMNGIYDGKDRTFYGINTDSREVSSDELFFALRGPNFNGNRFSEEALMNNAAACVVDDGSIQSKENILVENTQIALGQLARAWQQKMSVKIIAITGSNGKTSVKQLLSNCLSITAKILSTEGNFNNHIGLPLMLLRLDSHHEYAILEMGANHPKEIEYLVNLTDPHVVLINNAGPAHLEGFKNVEGVAKAKGEILQGSLPPKYACLNYDDKYFDLWCKMAENSSVISFGLNAKATIFAEDLRVVNHKSSFTLVLPDSSINIIKQGLEAPLIVPGRLHALKGIRNHCVIDDSYNANPTSTNAAIDFLSIMEDYNCLVLGDMKELGSHSIKMHSLAGIKAKESGIDTLLAIGDMTKYTIEEFGSNGYWFETSEELLRHLHTLIEDIPKMNILVKGSRSMQMDRIVKEII